MLLPRLVRKRPLDRRRFATIDEAKSGTPRGAEKVHGAIAITTFERLPWIGTLPQTSSGIRASQIPEFTCSIPNAGGRIRMYRDVKGFQLACTSFSET